ncbi:hypothetical protein QRX50_15855 [Amycolatopsis carbonis]|uniref:Uncharacterized protein n=1 Tax=Amycolatopsis carbonis TaxID=715471 RepID=A0A9Y2MXB7_9PSEU|nr:hypothetical protein [Amycolatopsis sp. 2-15]WIX82121.1 hypothetical protein QRX50_15855 [Amycolatopsis sp. 2-15]
MIIAVAASLAQVERVLQPGVHTLTDPGCWTVSSTSRSAAQRALAAVIG